MGTLGTEELREAQEPKTGGELLGTLRNQKTVWGKPVEPGELVEQWEPRNWGEECMNCKYQYWWNQENQ